MFVSALGKSFKDSKACLVLLLLCHHLLKARLAKYEMKHNSNMGTTHLILQVTAELLICSVVTPPNFDYKF